MVLLGLAATITAVHACVSLAFTSTIHQREELHVRGPGPPFIA